MSVITEEEQLIAQSTVAKNVRRVIGTGIDFPFRFTVSGKIGSIVESNAGERINDSIHIILSTRIGERPFNPEFGSRLQELVFEPNDAILHKLLHFYTVDALNRWEKRIEILSVTMMDSYNNDGNMVGIIITYRIRNSHIKGSYVYPFAKDGMPSSSLYTGVEARRMMTPGALE